MSKVVTAVCAAAAVANIITTVIHIVNGEKSQAVLWGLTAILCIAIIGIRLHMEYERERDETEN